MSNDFRSIQSIFCCGVWDSSASLQALQTCNTLKCHSHRAILGFLPYFTIIPARVFEAIPAHHRHAAARAHPCGESPPWKKRPWLLWPAVSPPWVTCVAPPGACFEPMVWRCHNDSTLAPVAPVAPVAPGMLGDVHRSSRLYIAL